MALDIYHEHYRRLTQRYKHGKIVKLEDPDFSIGVLSVLINEALEIGRCFYCFGLLSYANLSIDHRTPMSRGGPNRLDNLRAICVGCNYTKRQYTEEEFISLVDKRPELMDKSRMISKRYWTLTKKSRQSLDLLARLPKCRALLPPGLLRET